MVKSIVHDPLFLAQKSAPATMQDRSVTTDLIDTLIYHRKECVGMAANMIGVLKRIIDDEPGNYRKVGRIRSGGGLPVAGRHAQNHAL